MKRYSTTIYFKVKLSNAQICLQLTQQHYSWIDTMRSEYIISPQRQPRRSGADKHAQIKRSDRKTKNKPFRQCKSAFFFSKCFIEKGHIGSASIKDGVKFRDFRFCCLFWRSIWLNYSTKQVFQDRNQASKQLKLSCNAWCDSSRSSPTLPLVPREVQEKAVQGFFSLTVGSFHTLGFSLNPSFPEWQLVLQRLKKGRINF